MHSGAWPAALGDHRRVVVHPSDVLQVARVSPSPWMSARAYRLAAKSGVLGAPSGGPLNTGTSPPSGAEAMGRSPRCRAASGAFVPAIRGRGRPDHDLKRLIRVGRGNGHTPVVEGQDQPVLAPDLVKRAADELRRPVLRALDREDGAEQPPTITTRPARVMCLSPYL
jgi:hypothetical protein